MTKVLQSKVITTLNSNLNMYCNGIGSYSATKVKKMELIIGQALLVDDVNSDNFDDFSMTLG